MIIWTTLAIVAICLSGWVLACQCAESLDQPTNSRTNNRLQPRLDSTLDYSWLAPTQYRGTHPYSFRTGEWAVIMDVVPVGVGEGMSRLCFKVWYPSDGVVDYVPLCDSEHYETK